MANLDIANPSEEHQMLREMVREWTQEHVEPQAFEHDRDEKFNLELLRSTVSYTHLTLPTTGSV